MLNEMIVKINKEIMQEETALYLEKQKESINDSLKQLYVTLELDPEISTVDDVLAKMEEEGDLEDAPELQAIFEWIKDIQKIIDSPKTPNQDKDEALKQAVETITTQYNKLIDTLPEDYREEIVSALIRGIVSSGEGINTIAQNDDSVSLSLGQEEVIIKQSLLEIQQHIANMNISEEEFMKLSIVEMVIREVVKKHRRAGHILTLLAINNWECDVIELIEANRMNIEEVLQVIEGYELTKAEYETPSFDIKKKAILLFIENLKLTDEEKAILFDTAYNHIQAKENEYSKPFYQTRVGEGLNFGEESPRRLRK